MGVILTRLHKMRNSLIFTVVIGLGVALAFGLYSPSRDLTVALAGTSIYIVALVVDPLKGVLFWLITQPILESYLNISLGEGIPDLSLTRLSIGLATLLLLTRSVIGRLELLPLNKFDFAALLLLIGIMQSAPGGQRGISTVQNVFDVYWIPIFVYFVIRNCVKTQRQMHLVLSAVAFVGLYSAVYAIYEETSGNVLFLPNGLGDQVVNFYSDSGLRILRGIWGSNVGFGRVINLAIPILFYFYLRSSSPSKKIFIAICLVVAFGGLYLTYKRTAWIAMVAVMFVMQWFHPQFRRLFFCILIVFVTAVAFNWDDISSSAVYTDRINSQHSTSEGRTEGWTAAIDFWTDAPVFGRGYGQYSNLARSAGVRDQAIENEFLNILVSSGLVGFIPYIGILLLALYESILHYRGRVENGLANRDLITVFWGILAGYIIGLFTSTVTVANMSIPAMFLAIVGAILYARSHSDSVRPELTVDKNKPIVDPLLVYQDR